MGRKWWSYPILLMWKLGRDGWYQSSGGKKAFQSREPAAGFPATGCVWWSFRTRTAVAGLGTCADCCLLAGGRDGGGVVHGGRGLGCKLSNHPMSLTSSENQGLGKEMGTHSSILVWRIPWTEKPCGLQSMASQRVGHNLATDHQHTIRQIVIWGNSSWWKCGIKWRVKWPSNTEYRVL